jgi:preprotein translocase subunit SecF
MRLIKSKTSFDFIGKARYTVGVSVALILLSLVSLGLGNLTFGIDFTGGVAIHVQYPQEVSLGAVRSALDQAGYNQRIVQHFGSADTALIRLPASVGKKPTAVGDKVMDALKSGPPGAKLQSVQFIGPQAGQQLVNKAAWRCSIP